MRRWLLPLVAALVVAGVAFGLLHRTQEWTTSSPEALAEFQEGLQDLYKVYYTEAEAHFEKALQLDPGFVAPKVFLIQRIYPSSSARRKELISQLRTADLEQLSPRERLLARRLLVALDGHQDSADEMITDYLRGHPDDPYVLDLQAGRAFGRGDWSESERENSRLVEIVPNWVLAYNQMGYAQMAQGRFAEAEATFMKYRFIAPDQANPHDSLGELLALTGHYDRAEREFREALTAKPDFWVSYEHLMALALMQGDFSAARKVVSEAAAQPGFPKDMMAGMKLRVATWQAATEHRWDDLEKLAGEASWTMDADVEILAHDALLAGGRTDAARTIEGRYTALTEKRGDSAPMRPEWKALGLHLEGTRLLWEGRAEEAVKVVQKADVLIAFRDLSLGTFKLVNRTLLVRALRRAGQDARARTLLAEITAVNPRFVKTIAEPLVRGDAPAL